MTFFPFPHPPGRGVFTSFPQVTAYLSRLHDGWTAVRKGKTENVVEFTLTASSTTSTLTDTRISAQSALSFEPRSANAAAEIPTLYVSATTTGSATLTHANNGQTDRTFRITITG